MKDERKTEIRVGITVLVGLLLLIWIIGWAKNVSLGSERKEVKIAFDSIAGLEDGAAVSVNGYRKGYVDGVILKDNKVEVTASLDPDVKLKKDAEFSIVMLDLMGGKKIEIKPGNTNEELDYSEVQEGSFAGDISSAMSALSSVQNDLITVIKDVKSSLKLLQEFIGDKKFRDDLKTSAANLSETSGNLNKMVNENRHNFKRLIDNTNQLVNESNELLKKNKSSVESTLKESRSMITNADSLLTNMNSLFNEIKRKENNLGKALYDEEMLTDLQTMMVNVKELTKLLVDQLKQEGIKVDAKLDLF